MIASQNRRRQHLIENAPTKMSQQSRHARNCSNGNETD